MLGETASVGQGGPSVKASERAQSGGWGLTGVEYVSWWEVSSLTERQSSIEGDWSYPNTYCLVFKGLPWDVACILLWRLYIHFCNHCTCSYTATTKINVTIQYFLSFPFPSLPFFLFSYFKYGVQCNSKWLWIPYSWGWSWTTDPFASTSKGWHHRCASMCPVNVPWIEARASRASCMLDKHSTNCKPSPRTFSLPSKEFPYLPVSTINSQTLYFLLLGNPQSKREPHYMAFWVWFLSLSMMLPRLVHGVIFYHYFVSFYYL